MICEDWRDVPAAALRPAYDAERRRWATTLHWDLGTAWALVEQARAEGRLPGLVARTARGEVHGWAFYLTSDDTLQIGALCATNAATVRLLLDRILASPDAALARRLALFGWPEHAALEVALARRRFALARHLYLVRDLSPDLAPSTPVRAASLRPWQDVDAPAVVRLFEEAYRGERAAECFAPQGRREQWARYVGQLLHTPGCGRFVPELTVSAPGQAAGTLDGLAFLTTIAPGIAHLAQMAVAPSARGEGLAGRLLADAMHTAAAAHYRQVTLLVAEDNQPARRLYARAGFTERASFIYASRPVPNRLARSA
ncbi:MAG: GNAT family N-acetyltransferase [Vicinamibacterales bacterium]|nr:GNAT family N-acetyltransferase [Vicinamibacterales bacterium]